MKGVFYLQEPKKFFISFKINSGEDYATNLYKYLKKECGADAFISSKDMEYDMNKGHWHDQIDEALDITKVFILIITPTASSSIEIKRELNKIKDDPEVQKYVYIHCDIWNDENQTTITVNGESINLKQYQTSKFDNENDLIRKVYKTIPLIKEIQFS